jgi:hypothetical protein
MLSEMSWSHKDKHHMFFLVECGRGEHEHKEGQLK